MSDFMPVQKIQPDVTTATGTGNISKTTALAKAFRLVRATGHFNAATSAPVVISLDANAGAAYDTVIRTIVMSANTDFYFTPEPGQDIYAKGDEIKAAWTNDGPGTTYGLEIVTEEL